MKFQVIEFKWDGDEPVEYKEGYRYTHLWNPENGKYYELVAGKIELDESLVRELESVDE